MLHTLYTVKESIEENFSKKVTIYVLKTDGSSESDNFYDTTVDVNYGDTNSGETLTLGQSEYYEDAVKRANEAYKELRYVKASLKVHA